MWLRSVYAKTLRDHRAGALAWGVGPGLLIVATLTQFGQLVATDEARAALLALAEQFRWFETPVGITRPGGFATFRLGPVLTILPSIWMILAASRTTRGEEERRMLDLVLAAPLSRTRVIWQKVGALGTALVVMAAVLGTFTWAGGAAAGAEFDARGAYVFALNVALTAALFGAVTLLVSQVVAERAAAAGIGAAALALAFLLHSTSRVSPALKWVGYASPLYYAGLTKPLVPEVGISLAGISVLAALVAACVAGAATLFTSRDLGFGVRLLPSRALWPGSDQAGQSGDARGGRRPFAFGGGWSLRSPFLRDVRTGLRAATWWALTAAAFSVWMTAVSKQVLTSLEALARSSPLLGAVLGRMTEGGSGGVALLAMLVFTFVPLMLTAFAISYTVRWAAEEEEGRTEMLLSAPVSRRAAILGRFAALSVVLLSLAMAIGGAVFVTARAVELDVAGWNLLAASLSMVPVTMVIAGLGALLAGWVRAAAVSAALTLYVVAAFLVEFVGPIFDWPPLVMRLSVYDAAGSPLVDGWSWPAMLALTGTASALLAAATLRFRHKDLAR